MKTNGGKRENAGRKPKYGDSETKTIRVPICKIEEIETLLLSKGDPNQTDVETEALRVKLHEIENIVEKYQTAQNLTSPRWQHANKLIQELREVL